MRKGTELLGLSALCCCSRSKGFYSIKPYLKYKLICKDTTDDILSSVGVEAFKTMRKVEDEFTTEISENCAARKLRLFSLAGDVFSETEEKS